MTELVYTTFDKSDWGDGPWQNEPDKVQWRDTATGLPCLVKRGGGGAWCGYVGLAPGHPRYGKDYNEVELDVHGGLTYSAHCEEGPEEFTICHVPEPGEPEHLWWLGFDCAHAWDIAPGFNARMRRFGQPEFEWPNDDRAVYRDLAYVKAQTTHLAAQLAVRKEKTHAQSEPS